MIAKVLAGSASSRSFGFQKNVMFLNAFGESIAATGTIFKTFFALKEMAGVFAIISQEWISMFSV